MEQTLNYKIKFIENKELFDRIMYNYTGLFRRLYKHMEESADKQFITKCLSDFQVDKTIYDYCVVDVKMTIISTQEYQKDKLKELEVINKELIKLKSNKKLTRQEKYNKKDLINKKSFIKRTLNKDCCFGGKDLLRKITKLKHKTELTKNNKKRLNKIEKEYKQARKRNIFLWGQAIKKGNRKVDFHLLEGYIIFKLNRNIHIKINLIPFKGKKRQQLINKMDNYINNRMIPITVRISEEYVHITFDNEILSGYSFNETEFNAEIKKEPIRNKKIIRKEFFDKQQEHKLQNKIENRCAGIDKNPEFIGFSITDVNALGEVEKVIYQRTFDLRKLTVIGANNNKLKYEIVKIYDFIFGMCKHYKVSHFAYEELKNITTGINSNKGTNFNRLTKNIWHRNLQENLIKNRCDEQGIICNEINAAYSSFIGNMKYNYYDCAAASIEIGRRGYVKYKKTNFWLYPSIDKESIEKMSYLLGKDVSMICSWVKLYQLFQTDKNYSWGKWRNKNLQPETMLYSQKSNVHICS